MFAYLINKMLHKSLKFIFYNSFFYPIPIPIQLLRTKNSIQLISFFSLIKLIVKVPRITWISFFLFTYPSSTLFYFNTYIDLKWFNSNINNLN